MLPNEQYEELVQSVDGDALDKAGRQLALAVVDDLWADYLANVAELKGGIHWVSWGGRNPLYEFLSGEREIYEDFQRCLREEITAAFAAAEIRNGEIHFQTGQRFERGATWTYVTTDQPFGTLGDRIVKGLWRKFAKR